MFRIRDRKIEEFESTIQRSPQSLFIPLCASPEGSANLAANIPQLFIERKFLPSARRKICVDRRSHCTSLAIRDITRILNTTTEYGMNSMLPLSVSRRFKPPANGRMSGDFRRCV